MSSLFPSFEPRLDDLLIRLGIGRLAHIDRIAPPQHLSLLPLSEWWTRFHMLDRRQFLAWPAF